VTQEHRGKEKCLANRFETPFSGIASDGELASGTLGKRLGLTLGLELAF